MPVNSLRADRERAIQALSREHPKTFFAIGERRKPIKLGIEKDIEAEMAKDDDHPLLDFDIPDAIAWYCSRIGYLKSCVAGASRLDLQGKAVAKITPAEAREAEAEAQEGIARMVARRKEQASNGLPQSITRAPAPPRPTAIPINGALSNTELLAELQKQIALVISVLSTDADDLLRKQLARSALVHMGDGIQTIVARLDK
jgi:ProP effector